MIHTNCWDACSEQVRQCKQSTYMICQPQTCDRNMLACCIKMLQRADLCKRTCKSLNESLNMHSVPSSRAFLVSACKCACEELNTEIENVVKQCGEATGGLEGGGTLRNKDAIILDRLYKVFLNQMIRNRQQERLEHPSEIILKRKTKQSTGASTKTTVDGHHNTTTFITNYMHTLPSAGGTGGGGKAEVADSQDVTRHQFNNFIQSLFKLSNACNECVTQCKNMSEDALYKELR